MTPQTGDLAGGNPEPERESDVVSVDTETTPKKQPAKRTTRRRTPASGGVDTETAPTKQPAKRTTRRRTPAGGGVGTEADPQQKPAKKAARRPTPAGGSVDEAEDAQPTEVAEAPPEKNPEGSAAEGLDAEALGEDGDDADSSSASSDECGGDQDEAAGGSTNAKRSFSFSRLFAFGVLPSLVLLLGGAAGYLKWQSVSIRTSQISGVESVAAAKDGTVAMLSYQPDTVEKELGGARERLTGTFKDSYTQLTHDVVIPGAKQKHISAVATVPAAASVSATANHAVAVVFVNQTVVVGSDPPSATASVVRVTLDKVGDRWLISGFDPV